jgi:PAS domain S-box-containing protein
LQLDVSSRLAAISRLTAGVAHEIKNPLNAMALHLEVLKNKLDVDEPEIDVIGREIKRLDTVVKTFLSFNKPIELQAHPIDLSHIAEERLRRSEAFLAEGQRLSQTGSWGWNASSGQLTWSPEHFRILGFEPDKTKPSLGIFWERVHPEDRPVLEIAFDRAIRKKRDFDSEFRIVLPDGSIRHVHGVGHAVVNESDDFVEFLGTTIDITERKRAEEALRNAQAELARVVRLTTMGELAASIAHEINQPLSAIVTNANACLRWLKPGKPDTEETRYALAQIAGTACAQGGIEAFGRWPQKPDPTSQASTSTTPCTKFWHSPAANGSDTVLSCAPTSSQAIDWSLAIEFSCSKSC